METDHRFASKSARGGPPRPRSTPSPQAARVQMPILETSETMTMDLYRKVPSTGQDRISVAVPQIRSSIPHSGAIADLVERVFRAHLIEVPSRKSRRDQWFYDRLFRRRHTSDGHCPVPPAEHNAQRRQGNQHAAQRPCRRTGHSPGPLDRSGPVPGNLHLHVSRATAVAFLFHSVPEVHDSDPYGARQLEPCEARAMARKTINSAATDDPRTARKRHRRKS